MKSLLKTLELLANIAVLGAEEAYKKISSTARVYIKSLLITTLLWLLIVPGFAILKATTGIELFGYLFVFTALVFTFVIGLLWAPLGILIGMLSGQTVNPAKAGNHYVKFVATFFFFELIASIYIMRVPMHQNIGAIPILIASVLAVALGSAIWGGLISGKFYVLIATLAMLCSTLSFFLPKTFNAFSHKVNNVDSSIAEFVNDSTNTDNNTSSSTLDETRYGGTRTISTNYTTNGWKEMLLPVGHLTWESSSDVQIKLSNGRIVDAPKDQWVKLGQLPGVIGKPKKIWVRGVSSPGQISFTIM